MALIENRSPGIRVLNDTLVTTDKDGKTVPVAGSTGKSFTIPRGKFDNEGATFVPGSNVVEIPDAVIERLRANDAAVAGLFDSEELVIKSTGRAQSHASAAESTEDDKAKHHKR
jgi:hypothetical protein